MPFREWIKEEKYAGWVENWLDRPYVATFFDVAALKKMLSEHREGKKNNARKIYTVLCFIIWYDRYFVNEESDN